MFETIQDVIAANKAIDHHWFDKEAMEFFKSKVYPTIYPAADGGVYFISSERFKSSSGYAKRLYTIRHADEHGEITIVGDFQQHNSRGAATRAIKNL